MTKLRVDFFSISLDGYGAGPNQSFDSPLGVGGEALHDWFVLTHYPRASMTMEGGTTFHFVTDGMHAALNRATEAAHGKDIRLAGGVAAIRQYLQAGLIDQLHLAIAPILLGSGESLFSGID